MAQGKRPQRGGDYQGKPKRVNESHSKTPRSHDQKSAGQQRPVRARGQQSRDVQRTTQSQAAPRRRDVHVAEGNYIEGRRAAFEALRTAFPSSVPSSPREWRANRLSVSCSRALARQA